MPFTENVRALFDFVPCPTAEDCGHGRRKRGVCRGSDAPTIYVGNIDMYIPLEKKSNTYPCKLYAARTEMLGKAV